MKKNLLLMGSLLFSAFCFSQVGINTTDPKSTLDVMASPTDITKIDGILLPRLTGEQLKAKDALYLKTTTTVKGQTGTIVYITTPLTSATISTKTANVLSSGYYYFDGDVWQKLLSKASDTAKPSYFYIPSFVLPSTPAGVSTSSSDDIWYNTGSQVYTVNLFNVYSKQFSMARDVSGSGRSAIRSSSTSTLDTYPATALDYFITYFDNTVFDPQSITISNSGVLTYKVLATGTVSEKTFMNIVFKAK